MAWLFSLSAECRTTQDAAVAFSSHFSGFDAVPPNGSRHLCTPWVFDFEDAWWVRVCPENVSLQGINSPAEEQELTEIGTALYARLRDAPPYRYAIVGVEVDGFRSLQEFDQDIVALDFGGLVLADDVWHRLGAPEVFVPFSEGYRWRPFVRAR